METLFCGIYNPATSKQYQPIVPVQLSIRPKILYFKRVGKWDQDSIQLWKLNEPMAVSDWKNNRNPLVGPIENCVTHLPMSAKLFMTSTNDAGDAFLDFVVVLEPPESEKSLDEIHVLIPRNFQDTLSEVLSGPTPSQQAKSTEYKRHQTKPRPIFDGRYDTENPRDTEGLLIALYHPVFAQFRMEFANVDLPVPQSVLRSTLKAPGRKNLVLHLSAAIGHSLERLVNIDGTEPDGTIVHRPARAVEGENVALALGVINDEIGTGGSDPSILCGLSVRHFWAQKNRTNYRNATCCPTLILAVAGPWMAVFGAVFTDKLIIEPLTDLIRVVNLRLNSPHYGRIARLFHVFGNCLTSLAKYWDTLAIPSIPVSSMEHPHYFPHVNSYTLNNSTTSFRYLRPIDPQDTLCVTFLAETADPSPTHIVVKFVEQYGGEAHQLLADADLAPKLLYHGPLDSSAGAPSYGSLRMVVMEEVEGTNAFVRYQGRKAPESFVASIREAVHKLHEHGFVFGDLRRQNIMVTRDDKVKLIDFDWAGKEGEAEYPMQLSEKIQWAPGVGAMEKVYKVHDISMIDKLYNHDG
ncbi:uncharacterized protein EV420DRAFT_1628054 [Desarmillaria tabescens]|uniref:Protein kinase domain-containing protein n=1 Tax=Armillaria tabescens TaxID=1929756 RepID=A0AA39NB69_ARMTA|nr:uncharacterized protein EV420DRAFT_1628054 [Desarmillaria tabescens]KAK0462415.1 hypothetical protein EV420DRAFT_1628054 [Desarmillaria tabescens]